ncbi:stearoyl-CoA 9-desaturase [Micromonospora arborensis]|uniref:Stearoyl-CoA 9-desaturase n=1 Tax=Micromonospora arborensis TaxID=2116518 RepID=A0A318NGH5_9ACTN|nr:fatty acid desaturase [Micromonospora arborensis]PYC65541.1 stearoyl-CoA 9-desaturase [Micromonospora arborensis]
MTLTAVPASIPAPAPSLLFARARTTGADERVFLGKLGVLALITAAGATLALRPEPLAVVAGVLLLAAMYTHAVELQHQVLHHSAFRRAWPHRLVGVPLGLPLFVVYSHYRVRHLQHHRFLGTPHDTEFFGFDTRQSLTFATLLRGSFDYHRVLVVLRDVVRSAAGRWNYEFGDISPKMRRHVVQEHLVQGAAVLAATGLALAGLGEYVLLLWVLPVVAAVPMHFLVELPEHILCDTETTNVLHNTRSIRGSWLSTWYTNGNNLHIEHHAAMSVPINQLPARHEETRRLATHVERTYADFYRTLWQALRAPK